MRILFLPGSATSPAARFRLLQYVEPLRRLGHDVAVRVITPERNWKSGVRFTPLQTVHNYAGSVAHIASALWLLRDADRFDVVMMNRDVVPELHITFLEPWLARRNRALIFDFDDAINVGGREAKLRKILPLFAWLTPGNEHLAEFARAASERVTVIPTVVDMTQYFPAARRESGIVRIGWSGSTKSAEINLPFIRDTLVELAKVERFEFVVISNADPRVDWPGVSTRFIPWTPETEVSGLQQIDVGVMPLEDGPQERGKCGLKAIQYMGVGVPAVVSPVGANATIVLDGQTGYHCDTREDWLTALPRLIHDEALRHRLGDAGRAHVEANYSLAVALPRLLQIFESVRS